MTWQIKKLGEVCDIFNGNSINVKIKKKKYFGLDSGYPFIATKDISFTNKIDYENGVKIPKNDLKFKISKTNSVLICAEGGSAGRKIGFTEKEVCFGNKLFSISSGKQDNKFIYYFCFTDYFQKEFKKSLTGIIGGVSLKKFKDIKISFPFLSEQHRIVKILDEIFEKIEKEKENAAKNLQNSKELFDYYLNNIFTNQGDDKESKKLGEVAEYFNGLTYSPKDVSKKGIIVLRSSNVQDGELNFSDIVRVNIAVKDKIIVRDGDVLMCSRNGSKRLVGKTATIKNLTEKMTFGTFMMVIRSQYNSYLAWFFKSIYFRKQISGGENTMINQITRYMLDDITLYFPSVKIQNEIVKKLSALSAETKKLETIYKQKLADLEELKKSILKKAFDGEL